MPPIFTIIKPDEGIFEKPCEVVMFIFAEALILRSTNSDNTLIRIAVDFGPVGGILMNKDDPDLQKDLGADVFSTLVLCEHEYCPRFFACSSNPIELVDMNDEVRTVSLKTKVDTFERNVFVALPE